MLRLCVAAISLSKPKLEGGKIYPRPQIKCKIGNREVTALADSGASLSVISDSIYRKIWGNWKMVRLPMPNNLRVTSISGHSIKFIDYVMMEIEMMGRTIHRPILVATGMDHTELVIGWDTIKEERMIVDGVEDKVYFKDRSMKEGETWHAAALCAITAEKIEPRMVVKMTLEPRIAEKVLEAGTLGICYGAHGAPLTIWDTLTGVNNEGRVTMVVANFGEETVNVKPNDCIGFMKNPEHDETEIIEGNDEFIHAMFGEMGEDCKEPEKGCVRKLDKKEEEEFLSKLSLKCPQEWRQRYLDLILRYNDVFSKDKFDLGWCDVIEHKINMKTDDPVYVKQFRVPYEHQAVLHEFVDELLKKGAIQDSKSPYNSPVFCVPKKAAPGASPDEPLPLRCVLDFRAVNMHAVPQKYSMKDVRECLDDIGRADAKWYSQLDLTSGFWQMSLAKESRPYTAFTVPGKLGAKFEWTVMPMGLQGSSSSFARLLNYVLRGVNGISSYIDDVLAFSDTHENHLKVLEDVFLRLRKYGLKLNQEKSVFVTTECQYLGFTLRQGEITTSKDKAAAIRNFPEPRTPRAAREFLGISNYFRSLIRNYHQKAEPLMKILHPNSGWKGGELPEAARTAYRNLQQILTSEPVLTLPKKDRQYILYTDGALGDSSHGGGMGAVLLQEDDEGQHHAIGYASRALKKNEQNYCAFLLEQATVVWAITYFEHYLAGQRFVVRCDNKPTVELGTVHKKTLSRLQELMLQFDFQLEHVQGKDNLAADALSRNACVMAIYAIDENEASVEIAQKCCPEIGAVKTFLETEELPENEDDKKWVKRMAKTCYVEDGLVWHDENRRGHRKRQLLLVPRGLRKQLIEEAHCRPEAGHGGVDRTAEKVLLCFWWPNLRHDVEIYVKECIICQMSRSKKPPPATLIPLPITSRPNERVHIDLFGELKTSHEGNKFICVITDSFSKYTELVAIPNKSAESVAKALFERWIIRFSAPECLVSDNGKEFANAVVDELLKLWGIKGKKTTPYHPQTNSCAERYNQSIIAYMKNMLTNETTLEWEGYLPMLQLSFNSHVHRATLESPFYMIYGRDPRLPYTNFRRKHYGQSYASAQMKAQTEAWERAVNNMREAEEIRKKYYAQKSKERNFNVGDRVLLHCPQPDRKANKKFWKFWKLCRVVEKVGPVNLKLKAMKEEPGKKNKFLVHVDRCQQASQLQIQDYYDSNRIEDEVQESEKEGHQGLDFNEDREDVIHQADITRVNHEEITREEEEESADVQRDGQEDVDDTAKRVRWEDQITNNPQISVESESYEQKEAHSSTASTTAGGCPTRIPIDQIPEGAEVERSGDSSPTLTSTSEPRRGEERSTTATATAGEPSTRREHRDTPVSDGDPVSHAPVTERDATSGTPKGRPGAQNSYACGPPARGRGRGSRTQRRTRTGHSPSGPRHTTTRVTRSRAKTERTTENVSSNSERHQGTSTDSPKNSLYLPSRPIERMGKERAKQERRKILKAVGMQSSNSEDESSE